MSQKKAGATPVACPVNPYASMRLGPVATFDAPVLVPADVDDSTALLRDKVNARATQLVFGVTDIANDPCGRRTVARQALAPGTIVLQEKPMIWTPFWDERAATCRGCTKPLPTPATERDGSEAMWAFCSAACKDATAWLVALEAPLTPKYAEICSTVPMDPCLLRVAVQLILTQAHARLAPESAVAQQARGERFAVGAQGFVESSLADVQGLASHEGLLSPESAAVVAEAARLCWPHVPAQVKTTLSLTLPAFTTAIVAMSSRINANAHALHQPDAGNPFGLGLFPTAAFFNHSCYPNCVFVNAGASLVVRAIRPVRAGEELCVNYTSLDADRLARRTALLREKSFFCHCRRCELAPADEDERRHFAADAALAGVRAVPLSERDAAALSLVDTTEAFLPAAPGAALLGNGTATAPAAAGVVINMAAIPGGIYIEDNLPFYAPPPTAAATAAAAAADAAAADAAAADATASSETASQTQAAKTKGGKSKGGKGGNKKKGGKKGGDSDSDFDFSDDDNDSSAAAAGACAGLAAAAAAACAGADSSPSSPVVDDVADDAAVAAQKGPREYVFASYPDEPSPGSTDADEWQKSYLDSHTARSSAAPADAPAISLRAATLERARAAHTAVARASEIYQADGGTMAGRRAALDAALLQCKMHLVPGHELFFTVLPLLVNVATKQRDFTAKLEFARAYAAMAERVFPAAFPPLSNVFVGLEQAAARVEEAAAGAPGKKLLAGRMRALRKTAYARQIEVTATCYGKDDARVKALQDKLSKL